MHSRWSFRNENECLQCEHRWLAPLGVDLEPRCPRCRSVETHVTGRSWTRWILDLGLFGVILAVILVVGTIFTIVVTVPYAAALLRRKAPVLRHTQPR